MSRVSDFVFRRRGHGNVWHWTDVVTWVWLIGGTIIMFGPALWLISSSFKGPAELAEFPPTILPYQQITVQVDGYDAPLPLYTVESEDGTPRQLAEIRRIGTNAQMVDPAAPDARIDVNIADRRPIREVGLATENYVRPLVANDFLRFLWNSVFVTVMATLITLLTNSMAAFALSKYQFRGRDAVMLLIVATLMVPLWVILVPLDSVVSATGLLHSL